MNLSQTNDLSPNCPGSIRDLREQLHARLDQILDECEGELAFASMLAFETALRDRLHALGALLIRLFLLVRHRRCESEPWLRRGYRVAQPYADRTLQTFCGAVRYGRDYLILRKGQGPGVHPLDVELGLTRDSYTPLLIGWFCRLCTRLSFRVACEVGGMFLGRAPAASTAEEWVLGLGKPAYQWLSTGPLPEGDGEVLVIECDGKAAPTATDEELNKRRRPHRCKDGVCSCQRHRGRAGRKARGRRKRRQRGDKSKNGRSATLVVMYTLKRGEDDRLHGPIHKKVFASFNSRRRVLAWARKQATRRGFPPGTSKTVQILIDGEVCLEQRMTKLFPGAIVTLDIHHARERLWTMGRRLHAEGSQALADWVEPLSRLLSQGRIPTLLKRLRQAAWNGPECKEQRKQWEKAIGYFEKRRHLMSYGSWRKQDLVLASGQVEGAARHVVGERLDQSGMRWIVDRAESVLLLRCVEVNGDWDRFFAWSEEQRLGQLRQGKRLQIRSPDPIQKPKLSDDAEKQRLRRKEATKAKRDQAA